MAVKYFFLALFFFFFTLSGVGWCANADDEQPRLKVLYLEFPPYYYTGPDGQPAGFLMESMKEVFVAAGVDVEYESMPAKRILQEVHTLNPVVSVGWFKTTARERFANFSLPIYQNKPLSVIYLRKYEFLFEGKNTLADILADDCMVMGMLAGYSYGQAVDSLVAEHTPFTQKVVGEYIQLVRMLAAERFSYTLIAPEEIETMIKENRLNRDQFVVKPLADLPDGNRRYLMFSRGVPRSMVGAVNSAIRKNNINVN